MNCPSRTDDVTEEHPTWNQNPPFLAPDLTTCQDLNGIANAREHRKGSGGSGGANDGDGAVEKNYFTNLPLQPDGRALAGGWWSVGPHPQAKGAVGGEGHPFSSPTPSPFPSSLSSLHLGARSSQSTLWGWTCWTASVVCCAGLLSALRNPEILLQAISVNSYHAHTSDFGAPMITPADSVLAHSHGSTTRFTKRSDCPSGGLGSEENYNTSLHVGALLIILFVSFFACAFPLIAARFPGLRIPSPFFFAVRHFGTGVLLATAFVHLLPTAFILLGNPCLSSFWVDDYPAMPGAIALGGIFFVTLIEMVLQPARHIAGYDDGDGAAGGGGVGGCMTAPPITRITSRRSVAGAGASGLDSSGTSASPGPLDTVESLPMEMGPLHGTSSSIGRRLPHLGRGDAEIEGVAPQAQGARAAADRGDRGQAGDKLSKVAVADEERDQPDAAHGAHSRAHPGHHHFLTPAQQHQKDILQCMMLEVGILFHSVFIGMTLSVSIGHEFIILLIAIAFHQTFEGLALGSRISTIAWPEGSWQPWLMCLAYGCTTPIGQAIGLATHMLYNPESEFGLVLVGTMNAISSGLLVFASLIELLSEDFLTDESWRVLRGRRRVYACLLVLFGALGMSLVGAWA